MIQNKAPALNANTKRPWQRVDGLLLLDKPSDISSNAALQTARRLFSAARAGHAGTLDPMATGLLPIGFGEATKFFSDLLVADKTYEAALCFGVTTNTGDAEGEVLERRAPEFDRQKLEATLEKFHGRLMQVPPMYSALKRGGQPLYKLARQGITLAREAREVVISELALLEYSEGHCRLRVRCGKGTYIRTLAEDIGRALGCGAHLSALRRTAVGNLDIAHAFTLDALATLPEDARKNTLLPLDTLLQKLPEIHLDETQGTRFRHGNPVEIACSIQGKCRVYTENGFLGVGEAEISGIVRPSRLTSA